MIMLTGGFCGDRGRGDEDRSVRLRGEARAVPGEVVVKVREALGRRRLEGRRRVCGKRRAASRRRMPRHWRPIAPGPAVHRLGRQSPALRTALWPRGACRRSSVPVRSRARAGLGQGGLRARDHERGATRARPALLRQNVPRCRKRARGRAVRAVRGAFTGADSRSARTLRGTASGGTLFLDEVSETARRSQRSSCEGSGWRDPPARVDAGAPDRSADRQTPANVDLAAAVKEVRFRKDLFYRLRSFPVRIPPLASGEPTSACSRATFATVYSAESSSRCRRSPRSSRCFRSYAWRATCASCRRDAPARALRRAGQPIASTIFRPDRRVSG